AFRIAAGYQRLLDIFERELETLGVTIHRNTRVSEINWNSGSVRIKTESVGAALQARPAERSSALFTAKCALITAPLGVLQSNSIHFNPELPASKKSAMQKLAMGKVIRITLSFRERFWQ